jgi:hypothetical protein
VAHLRVTFSCWRRHVSHSVGDFILAYPSLFASLLMCDYSRHEDTSSQHEQASSRFTCELGLTPCAGDSTAGSLLIDLQAVHIANLP